MLTVLDGLFDTVAAATANVQSPFTGFDVCFLLHQHPTITADDQVID